MLRLCLWVRDLCIALNYGTERCDENVQEYHPQFKVNDNSAVNRINILRSAGQAFTDNLG